MRIANLFAAGLLAFPLCAAEFASAWPEQVERPWVGPEYWANPLQDWRISEGRLEALVPGGNRNVNLLTYDLGADRGGFTMSVRLGRIRPGEGKLSAGWVGFRAGIRGQIDDYRHAVLRGRGLDAGVNTDGRLFIGKESDAARVAVRSFADIELRLDARPQGGGYRLTLSAQDARGRGLGRVSAVVEADRLIGNVALVVDSATSGERTQNSYRREGVERKGNLRFWFRDWRVSGSKLRHFPERAFGPILWAQHALSRGVLKMTAQMPPLGRGDEQAVALQIQENGAWKSLGDTQIDTLARTAGFRIENWPAERDVPYRLVYRLLLPDGSRKPHYWTGTVRREPVEKETLVVAAFTGNKDTGFPNSDIVRNVGFDNPDVLFFSGDQIYEDVAGYGIQRLPVETAALDYLRKWYLLGWAFGDLMRDRVTVHMPDDHDVYQGNIWGGGGRRQSMSEHQRGGYVMPPEWGERSPTHADLAPAGPVRSASDRAGHRGLLFRVELWAREFRHRRRPQVQIGTQRHHPADGRTPGPRDGPEFRPERLRRARGEAAGRAAIGVYPRLGGGLAPRFFQGVADSIDLRQRGNDAWDEQNAPGCRPRLQRLAAVGAQPGAGRVAQGVRLHDRRRPALALDRSSRNRRIRRRRLFVLRAFDRRGIPAGVRAGDSRAESAGRRARLRRRPLRRPGQPHDHLRGRQPEKRQRKTPLELLHDKASGYGLVRFNKTTRRITMECRRLLVDPSQSPEGTQFAGWPRTIAQTENYGRKAAGYLPRSGCGACSIPLCRSSTNRTAKSFTRCASRAIAFRPKIFRRWGTYTVRVGEPESNRFQERNGLAADAGGTAAAPAIRFAPAAP